MPPQPFGPLPHSQESELHVAGLQVHTWFTHVGALDDVHPPQSRGCPQLSVPVPHIQPSCAHVFGAQPHVFATPPPPHVWGAVH